MKIRIVNIYLFIYFVYLFSDKNFFTMDDEKMKTTKAVDVVSVAIADNNMKQAVGVGMKKDDGREEHDNNNEKKILDGCSIKDKKEEGNLIVLDDSKRLLSSDDDGGTDAGQEDEGNSKKKAKKTDGVVMTKLDGDARGGALLSVKHVTQVPIKFIGTGEQLDSLEPFRPEGMAGRILGLGDKWHSQSVCHLVGRYHWC